MPSNLPHELSNLSDADLVRLTRERCRLAMRNTATGAYLAEVLDRLAIHTGNPHTRPRLTMEQLRERHAD